METEKGNFSPIDDPDTEIPTTKSRQRGPQCHPAREYNSEKPGLLSRESGIFSESPGNFSESPGSLCKNPIPGSS